MKANIFFIIVTMTAVLKFFIDFPINNFELWKKYISCGVSWLVK